MSERRPSKPDLYERTPCEHPEATGPHTTDGTHRRCLVNPPDAVCGGPSYEPVDPVAAIRAGVESGTIKGSMRVVRSERNDNLAPNAIYGVLPGTYIIIPVSDGGSET